MKKEKALLESILPRRMVRTLQEEICNRIEDQDKNITPLMSTSRCAYKYNYNY